MLTVLSSQVCNESRDSFIVCWLLVSASRAAFNSRWQLYGALTRETARRQHGRVALCSLRSTRPTNVVERSVAIDLTKAGRHDLTSVGHLSNSSDNAVLSVCPAVFLVLPLSVRVCVRVNGIDRWPAIRPASYAIEAVSDDRLSNGWSMCRPDSKSVGRMFGRPE